MEIIKKSIIKLAEEEETPAQDFLLFMKEVQKKYYLKLVITLNDNINNKTSACNRLLAFNAMKNSLFIVLASNRESERRLALELKSLSAHGLN